MGPRTLVAVTLSSQDKKTFQKSLHLSPGKDSECTQKCPGKIYGFRPPYIRITMYRN